jgi:hypothetical protein
MENQSQSSFPSLEHILSRNEYHGNQARLEGALYKTVYCQLSCSMGVAKVTIASRLNNL